MSTIENFEILHINNTRSLGGKKLTLLMVNYMFYSWIK